MTGLPAKIAVALVAVVLAFGGGYVKGRNDGRAAQLEEAVQAYRERGGIDAKVSNMDAYSLCVGLGGLHDECARLSGLHATPKGQ